MNTHLSGAVSSPGSSERLDALLKDALSLAMDMRQSCSATALVPSHILLLHIEMKFGSG